MNRMLAELLIRKHEGVRYVVGDTEATTGIGFNLNQEGADTRLKAVGADPAKVRSGEVQLTESQVSGLFKVDLNDAIGTAHVIFDDFSDHPEDVQAVIVDMIFNLGPSGFAGFTKTIDAFKRKDYCTAAAQMGDSKWAAQVPNRARENISIVMNSCHA